MRWGLSTGPLSCACALRARRKGSGIGEQGTGNREQAWEILAQALSFAAGITILILPQRGAEGAQRRFKKLIRALNCRDSFPQQGKFSTPLILIPSSSALCDPSAPLCGFSYKESSPSFPLTTHFTESVRRSHSQYGSSTTLSPNSCRISSSEIGHPRKTFASPARSSSSQQTRYGSFAIGSSSGRNAPRPFTIRNVPFPLFFATRSG